MHKFNRVLATLLLESTKKSKVPQKLFSLTFLLSAFFMLLGWQVLSTQNTSAQATLVNQQMSWTVLFEDNPPPVPKKPGVQREPNISVNYSHLCAIAPEPARPVWSDHPMFVWQANVGRIEVQSLSGEQLWHQNDIKAENHVSYTGEALQLGASYRWVAFDPQNKPLFFVLFKVMDAQKHRVIENDLQKIEDGLKGASAEEKAMQRAQFFAKKQLWSDFWREVLSVDNPSPALTEIVKTKTTELCSKVSAPNSSSSR